MNLDTLHKRRNWWNTLELQWQIAFNEAVLNKPGIPQSIPTDEELLFILQSKVLRLAGPRASFPNLSIELTNCSGIEALKNLEILVLTFHQIKELKGIEALKQLKSLFVNNNQIESLVGLEQLKKLEELYFNVNQVKSLKALKGLTKLKTVYCNYNQLNSLEGIQPKHSSKMRNFFCLPNQGLSNKEIIRVEHKIGIRCQQG